MKGIVIVGLLMVAPTAWAQTQTAPARTSREGRLEVRYQIGVMERVLEQAVQHGAQLIGRQLQALAPNLLLFTGPARARGFLLEGYGVFFDIEVPALRRSLTWSFTTLNRDGLGIAKALDSLRQHVESVSDAGARTGLEQALKRIELQVGPPAGMERPGLEEAPDDTVDPSSTLPDDPGEAYTQEVKRALIDAMLDHSGPMDVQPEEWFTVAARDNEGQVAPGEMYDLTTIMLRIRGADLADFRADRITREEARQRVEIREF